MWLRQGKGSFVSKSFQMATISQLLQYPGKKFYGLFEDVVGTITEISQVFADATYEENVSLRGEKLKQIEELDRENEYAVHKLFAELGKSYITPFDREDIHDLITAFDKISENLLAALKQLYHFRLNVHEDEVSKKSIAAYLQAMKLMEASVKCLRDKKSMGQMYKLLQEVRKICNESNTTLEYAIAECFVAHKDVKEIVKQKDHYEILETLFQNSKSAVYVLEGMIIKYN